jgi:hypothetical protein
MWVGLGGWGDGGAMVGRWWRSTLAAFVRDRLHQCTDMQVILLQLFENE